MTLLSKGRSVVFIRMVHGTIAMGLALLLVACTSSPITPPVAPALILSRPIAGAAQPFTPPPEMPTPKAEEQTTTGAEVAPSKSIMFPLAGSVLARDALSQLKEIAVMLSEDRTLKVTLVGYTDHLGSREYSVALATRRVNVVAQKLIAFGAQSRQLLRLTRGYESSSAHRCRAGECQGVLRRVDILLAAAESR